MTTTRLTLAACTAIVVIILGWGTPFVPAALFAAAILGGLWGYVRHADNDDHPDTEQHESHSLPTYFADGHDERAVWPGQVGGVE